MFFEFYILDMEMLISIITVVLNREATVEDTLQSVLTQTYPHIEYIVVDGGSVDNTVPIIEKYVPLFKGRLKYISEADSGIYEAMNKGLEMSLGDVVGFLNSDDVFKDESVVGKIARSFEKSKIDAVFGNVLYRRGNGSRLLRRYSGRHFYPGLLPYGIMPPHPSFYAKRLCYRKSGGYHTDFRIAGDYELLLRFLLKEKICYQYLDLDMVVMRMEGISNRGFSGILCKNSVELMKACRMNGIYTNWLMLLSRFFRKMGGVVKWLILPRYIWRK